MFRVQSKLEYPSDPVNQLYFVPEDYEVDLRLQYELHDLLRREGSPFPDSTPISGEIDPRHHFVQLAERFLIQAKFASDHAESYRNFNVGAMLYTEREPGVFGIFYGANIKLSPDSQKICAEQVALEKAIRKDYRRIIGVAVYGPTQQDHGSGLELPVLHPCEACRGRFKDTSLSTTDMLVASANPEGQYEFTDLKTIVALHEEGVNPDSINTHRVHTDAARSVIELSLYGWIPAEEHPSDDSA